MLFTFYLSLQTFLLRDLESANYKYEVLGPLPVC